jgi:DNA-binding MarR family transcriptional regulator
MTDAVFETSLLVARLVRAEARRSRPAGLSLSEFRALACLNAFPDCTLTELAEYLGLQLPTASKLADALYRAGNLTRREDERDRRRSRLALTPVGAERVEAAMAAVREHLRERLAPMPKEEQQLVLRAMNALERYVGPGATAPMASRAADRSPT